MTEATDRLADRTNSIEQSSITGNSLVPPSPPTKIAAKKSSRRNDVITTLHHCNCWELDNCLTTQCFPDKLTLKSLTHDRILNRYICLSRCPDLDYNTLRFLEQKIQQIVQSVL